MITLISSDDMNPWPVFSKEANILLNFSISSYFKNQGEFIACANIYFCKLACWFCCYFSYSLWFTDGIREWRLFNASIFRLSRSGSAAAISSAVGCLNCFAFYVILGSDTGSARGTGSNLGSYTSKLNLIDSSVGCIPFYAYAINLNAR
jgi:hypothetical protein